MSRVLADLLNPQGSHGQGGVFLGHFLRLFWPASGLEQTGASVDVEQPTTRLGVRRRMDIVIEFDSGPILAIENKVWGAADQPGQVRAYLDNLAAVHAQHRLIYLTRTGNSPPSLDSMGGPLSMGSTERFIDAGVLSLLSFPDLIPWLRACIGEAQNERVRGFLDDLIVYIHTEVEGISAMTELDLILDAATESPEHVRVAIEIANAGRALKERLLAQFKRDLKDEVAKSAVLPHDWELDTTDDLMRPQTGLSYRSAALRYGFRVDFHTSEANSVSIGIASAIGPAMGNESSVNTALKPLLGHGQTTVNWPWYVPFAPYPNWGNAPGAMAALSRTDGQGMAALIVRAWEGFYRALEENSSLSLLT